MSVGPPTEKLSLVFIAVPDCAEQTGAPWCPPHILPDGALLSAEGTEVLCSQCFPAVTPSCKRCVLNSFTLKHQAVVLYFSERTSCLLHKAKEGIINLLYIAPFIHIIQIIVFFVLHKYTHFM